ncbi:MAG: stage III sporulation protein AA [Clostridia bacterium]|nr:stage III sporulation protein AA [Clostridia bacterium]
MDFSSLFHYFPPEIAGRMQESGMLWEEVREIRLRAEAPPVIVADKTYVLDGTVITACSIQRTASRMCQNSVYARQEELRSGFVTLPGGHRAGFCGRTVAEDGQVRCLTEISSINLRIAHEVPGAADNVLPALVHGKDVYNTLVVSPPGAGKTTLLRDIARQLGSEKYGFRVGIADERGEIAAMYRGTPQNDIGIFTDVYDGCPKAQAMQMLLRGMAPQIVITDELGGPEDEKAVRALTYAGVRVICSIHGASREDALARPGIGELLRAGVFRKTVLLGNVGRVLSIT